MKIVLDEAYRSASQGRFSNCTVEFLARNLRSRDAFTVAMEDAEVLGLRGALAFRVDDELLDALPHLRFIQKSGTGVDAFDIDALTRHNVLLASNTGFNAVAVAEHTLLLMLLCLHQPRPHMDALRAGSWREPIPVPTPTQLSDKTVGIVGLGGIGTRVAQSVRGMGANVIACARDVPAARSAHLDVDVTRLDDLLERADVITLHVPLTGETERMIGPAEFDKMKRGAVLINTSRGRVVDEEALYQALVSGRLAAAGIDVFDQEPTPPDNPLLQLENVYATPHLAGFTVESNELQVQGSLANIEKYVQGIRPDRLINPEAWQA